MATRRSLRIAVVVLRESTSLVPVSVAELFDKVLELGRSAGPRPQCQAEVTMVGESLRVRTANGRRIECATTFSRAPAYDLVVVPALDPDVLQKLALNQAAVDFVRRAARRGADVASACTGAFVLGEAGLLEGRRATTHWAFQPLFQERYPDVRLEPQAILVDQGRVCTAGGATSFINLTLYLVERYFGRELARAASKMFLIDPNKSPQGAYAMFSTQRDHGDEEILRAQDLIETRRGLTASVADLARAFSMSSRTFARRFKLATGNTPLEYIQRVRIEHAKRLLESSRSPLESIASQIGYGDLVAFRKLFVRVTGLTPADYRRRYGPPSAPGTVVARAGVASR